MKESMQVASFTLIPGTDIMVEKEHAESELAFAQSLRGIGERGPGEPPVFRLLDLGTGDGVFATFAAVRFPYAWIDCYGASPLARMNVQKGTRFFDTIPATLPKCDALRVGLGVGNVVFDGDHIGDLKAVFWEFDTADRLSKSVGFLDEMKLTLVHVGYLGEGQGWTYWIRKRGDVAPSFRFDLSRKKKELLEPKEATP